MYLTVKGPSDSLGDHEGDYVMNKFSFYKCLYTGCIYPVPALLQPPTKPRPAWARDATRQNGWMLTPGDENTWVSAGPYQTGQEGYYPEEGSHVIISKGEYGLQHSANMPMQYTGTFFCCKNDKFQLKHLHTFLIFAQNIDCGCNLEPPQ